MLISRLVLASAFSSVALAAPGIYDSSTTTSTPAAPLFSWLSKSLTQWTSSVKASTLTTQDAAAEYAASLIDQTNNLFSTPDYSDYSIWQVIQENEYLSDFKKVLKYSGPSTKELLDDKSAKLTFLAPINWHKGKHHDEGATAQWDPIQEQIDELENESLWTNTDQDKDRKERKKKIIAYLIDKTVLYHVINSNEPLKGLPLSQNSSVATLLTVGKAKKVVGNLWDGEQFRLRVGKSLLPIPAIYFNFYSRVVKADVAVGESILHAVSFPILIPPSVLQSLFFAQTEFSALTSALQKVDADGYLKLPINESFFHHRNQSHGGHSHHNHMQHQSFIPELSSHAHHHHHPHGVGGLTLFAPANLAWSRLPIKLRLFLFSPFGEKVLGYILALHSLPKTIFFADWHHHVSLHSSKEEADVKESTIDATELYAATGESALGTVSVKEYTFDTACPKLHFNKTADVWTESKMELETVDVRVYRYTILPGNKGPLQTRITVNNVSVLFQDIPAANGAFHQLERFIMPKGHHHHDDKEQGLLAHIAHQAEKAGFGQMDLSELFN